MPKTNGGVIRPNFKEIPWFQLPRALAQDEQISYALRGLLAYLFSKSKGWEIQTRDLIDSSPAGRDATYRIISEGIERGYMHRVRRKNPMTGKFEWEITAYYSPTENPHFSISGKPVDGEPVYGKPVDGEPVYGKPISGKPISGKPGQLLYTEGDQTEGDQTEGDQTEGDQTEIDDDDGLSIHFFKKWGGGAGGGVALPLAMRTLAADIMAAMPDWDDGPQYVATLDALGIICLIEWDAHLAHRGGWARLDNPIGFLRAKVDRRTRPGLSTQEGRAIVTTLETHYLQQEIPY